MELVLVLTVLVQLPGSANADSLVPQSPLFRLDLTWTTSLLPAVSAPADAPEPPPLLRFDDAPNQIFSLESPSPGLQFSLDPDNDEIFLGWQIGF